MIKIFLLENRSWILFVAYLLFLFLFISFLDPTIPLESVSYIVFLAAISFIGFLLYRYHVETGFYERLRDEEEELPIAKRPYERIVLNRLEKETSKLEEKQAENELQLEQEKDEIIAWMHEVKTPLTAMKLMIDHLDDKEQKAKLTYEWLRIYLLLDKQLYRTRIPSIENDLFLEKVDVEQIIIREIKTLQTWCIEKGIGFDLRCEETNVITDAKWLAFIIRQLLTNAVKYSHDSDIIVSTYSNDGRFVIQIQDFGCGIAPQDLPRIFDKTFTSSSTRQNDHASGMGLYLTKKIADVLHIDIDVQSKPNDGTTFTLTFPKKNTVHAIQSM